MSVIWYLVFLGSFSLLAAFSLFFRNFVTHQANTITLNPHSVLVCSFFLYSSSLPISRVLSGSSGQVFDMQLLLLHLYGFLGFALGAVISVLITRRGSKNGPGRPETENLRARYSNASVRTGLFTALLVFFVCRYSWTLFAGLNFNLANILQPYGFEGREGEADTGLGDVFVYFGLYSLLVFGVIWDRHVRPLSKGVKTSVYFLILFFVSFWLLRGSRNMMMLLALPVVAAIYYRRKIRLVLALSVGLSLVVGFYMLAAVRSVGIRNTSGSDLQNSFVTLDILNGELGTSYSVLDRTFGLGAEDNLLLGKSYTYDVIINIVPHAIWPNRPDNLAIEFSKRYFNKNELSEGLGFSPVLEAYLNFGQVGIIGTFAVFYLLLVLMERRQDSTNIRNIMLMSFMLPILLNWNRIDMSTTFKMYSGFIAMAYILPWMLITGKRTQPNPWNAKAGK